MNLNSLSLILGTIVALGTIYKYFTRIKVEIKPVPDNFDCGTGHTKKWPHRMVLTIYNHGFSTITITKGELEIFTNNSEPIYMNILGYEFKMPVDKNNPYARKFSISEFNLPTGCEVRVILNDSKGKTFKSNKLTLSSFDPELNPI